MAYIKAYTRINWVNKEVSLSTPLGASNLNNMDKTIDSIDSYLVTADSRLLSLEKGAISTDQLKTLVKDWSVDNTTGIVTLTYYDGTTKQVNTILNQLAVNFTYDITSQKLIITESDGSTTDVDLSALINQTEFDNTDFVAFSVGANGHISASIPDGSITLKKLAPEVIEKVASDEQKTKIYAENAKKSADNAENDAKLSQSYAIGLSTIREGEDTDNSKYYSQMSESYAHGNTTIRADENTDNAKYYSEEAKKYRDQAMSITNIDVATTEKAGIVKPDGNTIEIDTDGVISAKAVKDYLNDGKFLRLAIVDGVPIISY